MCKVFIPTGDRGHRDARAEFLRAVGSQHDTRKYTLFLRVSELVSWLVYTYDFDKYG